MRISRCMGKYVYQIQGALEDEHQVLHGLRVIVCDVNNMEIVDVPIKVLDKETIKYLSFRLKLTSGALVIQNLPNGVINKIRMLLGKYLDNWVLINFYGHTSNTKSVNP